MSENNIQKDFHKPKTASEIAEEQIETGLKEHRRSNFRLFLSAFTAGLEIGFSVFLMGIIYTLFKGELSESSLHVILAISYPVGFILVLIGRSELFTEHTTLAVLPVLYKKASIKSLLVLWGLVYTGNILGGYITGYLISILPIDMGTISKEAIVQMAEKLVDYKTLTILGSGITAG